MIGQHEYEHTSLDHAIFNASLKAANVTFSTRLEHAMHADDVSKAREVIAKEFKKFGDSPVSVNARNGAYVYLYFMYVRFRL